MEMRSPHLRAAADHDDSLPIDAHEGLDARDVRDVRERCDVANQAFRVAYTFQLEIHRSGLILALGDLDGRDICFMGQYDARQVVKNTGSVPNEGQKGKIR